MDPNDIIGELTSLSEGDVTVDPDTGDVEMTIIRAGRGNKRNRHYYPAKMLESNYLKYQGTRMYKNHEPEAERRARRGLPRPIEQLGGVVKETWFDPTWPDEDGRPVGAVRGRATLFDKHMMTIARTAPHLLGISHDARASSVKPAKVAGDQLLVVEGLEKVNSTDIVSAAGAGGSVTRVLESEWEEGAVGDILGVVTKADLMEHRSDLVDEIKADALKEAGVEPGQGAPDKSKDFDTKVQEAADRRLSEATKEIEERVEAKYTRELQVKDNLRIVESVLSETKLPERSKADIRRRFDAPFYEATDDKPAEEQLREALQGEIKEKREELAEATGNGQIQGMGGTLQEGDSDGKPATSATTTPQHDHVLGYITR